MWRLSAHNGSFSNQCTHEWNVHLSCVHWIPAEIFSQRLCEKDAGIFFFCSNNFNFDTFQASITRQSLTGFVEYETDFYNKFFTLHVLQVEQEILPLITGTSVYRRLLILFSNKKSLHISCLKIITFCTSYFSYA